MNKKGEFVEIVGISLFGLGILFCIGAFIFYLVTSPIFVTSHDQHTGFITATETTGIFFKSHTAYVKTNTQSTQEDQYCVLDDYVFAKLLNAQENNKQVTITFNDYLIYGMRYCNEGDIAIITGVQ